MATTTEDDHRMTRKTTRTSTNKYYDGNDDLHNYLTIHLFVFNNNNKNNNNYTNKKDNKDNEDKEAVHTMKGK